MNAHPEEDEDSVDVDEILDLAPDEDENEDTPAVATVGRTPQRKKATRRMQEPPSISALQNPFDAYYALAGSSSRTSSNVFSSLVAPLSQEEYATIIGSVIGRENARDGKDSDFEMLERNHEAQFSNYLLELSHGFNILFYGFGSKRKVLNKFAANSCAMKGHVVVVNGFLPNFNIRDLVLNIERNIPDLSSVRLMGSGLDAQTRRIHDYYSDASKFSPAGKKAKSSRRPLFIIVHNIDSPALRTQRAKSCVSLLALNPHIHIVASVDHINAPLLWSRTDISTRKHYPFDVGTEEGSSTRGFACLWHELTTLRPYDVELSYADRSTFAGASSSALHKKFGTSGRVDGGTIGQVVMTESAAQHIIASVTQKARRLFILLGKRQLEAMEADEEKGKTAAGAQVASYALAYDLLFTAARDDFIVVNDTAMRALLGEFRDHGLVLSSATGGTEGGESLYVPLSGKLLKVVLEHVGQNL